ncbi:MAG: polysaccharide biosynthesis protein [Parcubacteria group bacterium Gr01-1014_2]|nr:MAG: polysaccharide biosynthesis protein [Parcubacteria group bacterium Gr01-1014_2]
MNSIYKNFFIASVSRFITAIVGLAIISFLTRHLGLAGYGAYETVLSYLFIFTVLADFGLHVVHVREISRHPDKESFISGNIFTLRLISLFLVVISAFIIGLFLPYSEEIKKGILVASIFVIFSSLSQILAGIFQKYSAFYSVSFSDVLTRLIQLGLVVYAVNKGFGLLAFIWILSLTAGIQFLIILLLSRRFVAFSLTFDFSYVKNVLKVSLPVAASILFTAIYIRTDALMLSLMKPQADVGIYRLAAKILETIVFFPALLVELTMPSFSALAQTSGLFNRIFKKTFNILFLMAIPVVAGLFLFAEPIVLILGGEEFISSAAPLRIMALVVGMVFLNNLGGKALIALEFQKAGMWIYLSGAVLNIISNLIVIPRYSYIGASLTTLMTEIIVTVMMFLVLYKKAGLKPDFKNILGIFSKN